MNLNHIAALCIIAAVTVALMGTGREDDLLAVGLLGLAGTICGRSPKSL